jgi:hypothetical protein
MRWAIPEQRQAGLFKERGDCMDVLALLIAGRINSTHPENCLFQIHPQPGVLTLFAG